PADRDGQGRGERPDQPPGPRRHRDAAHSRHPRGRAGALPQSPGQRDDPAGLHLLDRARLAGLGVEGAPAPGEPAAVRHELGVRGPQRHPGRLEEGAHRMPAATPARAAARSRWRLPHPTLVWAIAAAWAVAVAAQVTGRGQALHHDGLLQGGLASWAALGLFLLAWQLMIAAMML